MPLIRGKLVLYLKSAPSALSNSEISRKNKNGYLSDNNYFMWVFLGQNFKELLCYLKSAPSNLCHCKISQKKGKILRPKMTYLGTFGLEFLKAIVVFQMGMFKFVEMQDFQEKNLTKK